MPYINAQTQVTKQATRSAVPLPTRVRGGLILNALRKLPPDVVGPNPTKLALMLDQGFEPIPTNHQVGLDDFGSKEEMAASEQLVQQLQVIFTKAVAQAARGHTLLVKAGGPAHQNIDPSQMAVARAIGSNNLAKIAQVADAFGILAAVRLESPKGTPGRTPVLDAVYVLVRMMVAYLHEHGMPVASRWNLAKDRDKRTAPRTDDECLPVSPDADLLVRLAKLWGISAPSTTLRGALNRYLKQLSNEGRAARYGDGILIAPADA